MKHTEEKANSVSEQKRRIRERYKGISSDELDVIPAMPEEDFYDGNKEKRVAVYARVSTDDPRQTSSYELQKNHYEDVVSRRPDWKLVEIYADEGISGTSLKHRDAFVRMINDCKAGKIDLIVTKSVSRFARNIIDCVGCVRELKAMNPPIGVFFETENLYTLNANSEMSLSFISTLAQEESHNKSEIMNASIEMRFRRGIFLTPPLLGYDQDENGNLVVNEEEAKIVKLIFFLYLYGYSCQKIANLLTALKCKTKKGNTTWSPGVILQILTNERHCGDVLARKTYTPNYLDHKSKKNRKNRNQYKHENNHEAIISRDDFIAVQRLISNAKYKNKSILPEITVIKEGVFKGYVSINPRWAAFKVSDYMNASVSVVKEVHETEKIEVEAKSGEFDFRGFEVVRGQFFDESNKISLIFSKKQIRASSKCVRKLRQSTLVELLVNPQTYSIVIRPTTEENRNAVKWSKKVNGKIIPNAISGAAFLPTIFKLFGWNEECNYRVIGLYKSKGTDKFLSFNIKESEVLIPREKIMTKIEERQINEGNKKSQIPYGTKQNILAYPENWSRGFGSNYYYQSQADEFEHLGKKGWKTTVKSEPYKKSDLQITSGVELHNNIHKLIKELKENRDE
jgi:DNA invertase Pin-like site-specific DNA recombinase